MRFRAPFRGFAVVYSLSGRMACPFVSAAVLLRRRRRRRREIATILPPTETGMACGLTDPPHEEGTVSVVLSKELSVGHFEIQTLLGATCLAHVQLRTYSKQDFGDLYSDVRMYDGKYTFHQTSV